MDQSVKTATAPPVEVASELCSRFRCTKSDCTACAAVCPVPGAVAFTQQGAQVTASCVGCGACAAACPNGAIRPQISDQRLAARLRQGTQGGSSLRIGCAWAQARVDVVVPCLARLTEALLLAPIQGGASQVELLAPDCAACGFKKAAPQWERALAFTSGLCQAAGLSAGRVRRVVVPRGKAEEAAAPSNVSHSRRAMFRGFADRWKAVGVTMEAEQELPETFREIVQRHGENSKRSDLLKVLAELPPAKPISTVVQADAVPLAQLAVDQHCVACNVCETLCPVGALSHRDEGARYTLELDAARCTGCRVCEVACYHRAIHVGKTVDLALLFTRPRVTLFTAERRTCGNCRDSFVDNTTDLCPACRLSGDRREATARLFLSGGI
ncbi:4Fe-4S dicluster domain-containing protein [Rhodoferax sp.]|uniref:4Fe-4S dicluster domain-containing protein n=1 Tax=Rhodoferax sp. TaxID=50421 RepID=UPI002775449F|nr:4Fe-4S binding protein [Rhodoferax sp.]